MKRAATAIVEFLCLTILVAVVILLIIPVWLLASRRNSILYVEDNVAPQCSRCNVYRAGAANEFRKWMLEVRGAEVVERLEQLKTDVVQFTREQLVDMRLEFAARLKKAEEVMRG